MYHKKKECVTEGVAAPLVKFQDNLKSENIGTVSSNKNIGGKNSKIDAKIKLTNFLNQFKVEKGHEYTHTTMGYGAACYNIPAEHKEKLIDLLYQTIFVEQKPVHLTEKPPQHTIIKADLDFKYPLEKANRIYTIEHIKEIVELYNQAIGYYLDINSDQLNCFVFERDEPYTKDGRIKDGIHLMYPDIICDTKIQHLIREHVLLHCQNVLSQLGCKNNYDDIIDKAVVSTNNWLMYGCSKPDIKPYKLTKIYDNQLEECEFIDSDKELIGVLSIRDHDSSVSQPIKEEHKYLIEKKTTPKPTLKPTPKITLKSNNSSNTNTQEISTIIKLVEMLSFERGDAEETWFQVGLCLHNIDESLINSWIEFSRKSPKFKEGECEKRWERMTVKESGGLGIGSLHRWARIDNPEEYKKIKNNELWALILRSQSQTNYDVACVIHYLYKDQYKCVSVKNNIWYEFYNHKWQLTDSGVGLKKKISTNIVNEYLKVVTWYSEQAYQVEDGKKDEYLQKHKNLSDITYKLRDTKYKNSLMSELKELFYDRKFQEKFNQNPDLLGFDNGVYDLKSGLFRDGLPEDCISVSVGYDYHEFEEDDEKIIAIYNFLYQIFPDREIRDSVVLLLASFLEGRNPAEKFYFWTGSGGNGKSKLIELFELTFGQYAKKVPSTVFTQKRGSSSSASPEQACLIYTRFLYIEEPEDNTTFNVGLMKEWTGGGKMSVRDLYSGQIEFKPQFKPVLCCNKLPKMDINDGGAKRRVRVIQFQSAFVDNPRKDHPNEFPRDYQISEKFDLWKEAFMFILLEHYKVYKKMGIIEPEAVKLSTNNYWNNIDKLQCFVDEYLEKDPECFLTFDTIWHLFDLSEYRDKKIKLFRKDFKSDIERKIGPCLDRPTFNGRRLTNHSVFLGWKQKPDDNEKDDNEIKNHLQDDN